MDSGSDVEHTEEELSEEEAESNDESEVEEMKAEDRVGLELLAFENHLIKIINSRTKSALN